MAKSRADTGRVFKQKIRIATSNGNTLILHRITVHLDEATRDGNTETQILTNLSVRTATAETVTQRYRMRWTIETTF